MQSLSESATIGSAGVAWKGSRRSWIAAAESLHQGKGVQCREREGGCDMNECSCHPKSCWE